MEAGYSQCSSQFTQGNPAASAVSGTSSSDLVVNFQCWGSHCVLSRFRVLHRNFQGRDPHTSQPLVYRRNIHSTPSSVFEVQSWLPFMLEFLHNQNVQQGITEYKCGIPRCYSGDRCLLLSLMTRIELQQGEINNSCKFWVGFACAFWYSHAHTHTIL